MHIPGLFPLQAWMDRIQGHIARGENNKARFSALLLPFFEAMGCISMVGHICFQSARNRDAVPDSFSLLKTVAKTALLAFNTVFASYYGLKNPKGNLDYHRLTGLIVSPQEAPLLSLPKVFDTPFAFVQEESSNSHSNDGFADNQQDSAENDSSSPREDAHPIDPSLELRRSRSFSFSTPPIEEKELDKTVPLNPLPKMREEEVKTIDDLATNDEIKATEAESDAFVLEEVKSLDDEPEVELSFSKSYADLSPTFEPEIIKLPIDSEKDSVEEEKQMSSPQEAFLLDSFLTSPSPVRTVIVTPLGGKAPLDIELERNKLYQTSEQDETPEELASTTPEEEMATPFTKGFPENNLFGDFTSMEPIVDEFESDSECIAGQLVLILPDETSGEDPLELPNDRTNDASSNVVEEEVKEFVFEMEEDDASSNVVEEEVKEFVFEMEEDEKDRPDITSTIEKLNGLDQTMTPTLAFQSDIKLTTTRLNLGPVKSTQIADIEFNTPEKRPSSLTNTEFSWLTERNIDFNQSFELKVDEKKGTINFKASKKTRIDSKFIDFLQKKLDGKAFEKFYFAPLYALRGNLQKMVERDLIKDKGTTLSSVEKRLNELIVRWWIKEDYRKQKLSENCRFLIQYIIAKHHLDDDGKSEGRTQERLMRQSNSAQTSQNLEKFHFHDQSFKKLSIYDYYAVLKTFLMNFPAEQKAIFEGCQQSDSKESLIQAIQAIPNPADRALAIDLVSLLWTTLHKVWAPEDGLNLNELNDSNREDFYKTANSMLIGGKAIASLLCPFKVIEMHSVKMEQPIHTHLIDLILDYPLHFEELRKSLVS